MDTVDKTTPRYGDKIPTLLAVFFWSNQVLVPQTNTPTEKDYSLGVIISRSFLLVVKIIQADVPSDFHW